MTCTGVDQICNLELINNGGVKETGPKKIVCLSQRSLLACQLQLPPTSTRMTLNLNPNAAVHSKTLSLPLLAVLWLCLWPSLLFPSSLLCEASTPLAQFHQHQNLVLSPPTCIGSLGFAPIATTLAYPQKLRPLRLRAPPW